MYGRFRPYFSRFIAHAGRIRYPEQALCRFMITAAPRVTNALSSLWLRMKTATRLRVRNVKARVQNACWRVSPDIPKAARWRKVAAVHIAAARRVVAVCRVEPKKTKRPALPGAFFVRGT
jgi:hypothetical protein